MITNYIVNDLPKHPTKKYGKRSLSQIKRIVVHHFAGNITIEEAAKYHVSKGWPGIGYTIVVDIDGKVNITNNFDTVSYGVARNNTASLSIACRGNYEEHHVSSEVLDGLDMAINLVRNVLGPIPVMVHSDFVNTACPGKHLKLYVSSKY